MRIIKSPGALFNSVTLHLFILFSIGFNVDYPNHSEHIILVLVDSIEEKLILSENTKPIEQNYVLKRYRSITGIGNLSSSHTETPVAKNIGVLDIPQLELKLSENSDIELLGEIKSQPILSEGIVEEKINVEVKYPKIGGCVKFWL